MMDGSGVYIGGLDRKHMVAWKHGSRTGFGWIKKKCTVKVDGWMDGWMDGHIFLIVFANLHTWRWKMGGGGPGYCPLMIHTSILF